MWCEVVSETTVGGSESHFKKDSRLNALVVKFVAVYGPYHKQLYVLIWFSCIRNGIFSKIRFLPGLVLKYL